MDVARKLEELLPGPLRQPSPEVAGELVALLPRLSKREYEDLIILLPDRLIAIPAGPIVSTAKQDYIDRVAYHTLYQYKRHVRASEVVAQFWGWSRARSAKHAQRLVGLMSTETFKRLRDDLTALEARDLIAALDAELREYRAGTVDLAIEELVSALTKKASGMGVFSRRGHDLDVVKAAQAGRRSNSARLPKEPTRVAEVRFLVEEVRRELFVYSPPNEKQAQELIRRVYRWFQKSEMRARTRRRPELYLLETGFFQELNSIDAKIALGATYAPHWKYYVAGRLASDKFWADVSGLNNDIPLEWVEAGTREGAYRRGAMVTGVIFGAMLAAPVLLMGAVRAPGAAVRAFNWVGGRLLVGVQYAHATYRAYGVVGGMAVAGRDAYGFLLQRPIETTRIITQGAEIVLELGGAEMGMTPGTSPADAMDAIERIATKVVRKGAAELVSGGAPAKLKQVEVEAVEFVMKADGKSLKVTADVVDYEAGKLKVITRDVKPAGAVEAAADREIKFITGETSPVDARGVANRTTASATKSIVTESPMKQLEAPKVSEAAKMTAKQIFVLDAYQVQRIADVLAVPFTQMDGFAKTWNRFRTANATRIRELQDLFADRRMTKRQIADQTRDLFDEIRRDFWRHVSTANDYEARRVRDQLRLAGFELFPNGNAPRLQVPGFTLELDVDHKKELGQHAAKAFSPGNLRLAPSRENRVVLNQLMSRDAFGPDVRMTSGRGTSRAGKLHGDPKYRGRHPQRGLLTAPGEEAAHEVAAQEARDSIDAALRRLDDPDFEW